MKLRDKILFRCLLWRLPIPIPSTWMRQHFWISEFKFCKLSVSIFTATNYKKVSWFRSKFARNHNEKVFWLLLQNHLWFFDFMKDIKDYFSFIKVYFHKNCIKSDNLIRGKLKVCSWDSEIRYRKFKFQHFELKKEKLIYFYRTRVRSLGMLVTNSLPNSLTDSVTFSKLDWCDPGVWRCQLKTCWGCYCCWCW